MIVTSYRTYTVFGRFCYDFCVTPFSYMRATWFVVVLFCGNNQSCLLTKSTAAIRHAFYMYVAVCTGMQVSKYGSIIIYCSHKSFIF